MKIALAQINPVIADIDGNTAKILDYIARAKEAGAELAVFPELTILGYPPMDLLEHPVLIDNNLRALERVAAAARDIAVVCGFAGRPEGSSLPGNGAAFLCDGQVQAVQYKTLLPTYDVFDEQRYFSPARSRAVIGYRGRRLGLTICEDIWNDRLMSDIARYTDHRDYRHDPVEELVDAGADLLINISASPFVCGKNRVKRERVMSLARRFGVAAVYVNQAGGNDSLVFDGASFAVNAKGEVLARAARFGEDLCVFDSESTHTIQVADEEEMDDIEQALVLGVRDYARKCGFSTAVLGLSGGIDSAVTAAIAVKALGADRVLGITMPSRFSSKGSVDDSVVLARNLGMRYEEISIARLHQTFLDELAPLFAGTEPDVTEENIQARIRGSLLMAASNKFNSLLLTTGNKSELSVGYCTLYGDMNGGLAVISDLYKTVVYRLAEYMNREGEIIPRSIIDKAPSAELREYQKDQDSLPVYPVLDAILEMYIEQRRGREDIVCAGHDPETVDFVLRAVNRNEYKRRQAAPGIKVTSKAFGTGRRAPMAQRFKP
jgi:NAD+ synthetase